MRLSRTFWMLVTVVAFAIMIWGFITLRNASDAENRRDAIILSEEEAAYISVEFSQAELSAGSLQLSGTASPGSTVSLYTNSPQAMPEVTERIMASATTESDGTWTASMPLGAQDMIALGIMSIMPDGTSVRSVQTLYRILEPQSGKAAMLIVEPGAASRILKTPFGRLPQSGELFLETIEYDNAGGIIVAGTAPVDRLIRIYANKALLAETGTGPDGRWRMVAGSTLPVGAYEIGITAVEESQTVAQLTVPFERFAPNSLPAYEGAAGQITGALFKQDVWQVSRALYGGGYQQSVIYSPLILVP